MRAALTSAMRQMNEALRRASVTLLGDDGAPRPISRMSTGIAPLDETLGGGLPRGRLVELYGGPGAGKSTLAASIVAGAQACGHAVALLDSEAAFDPVRAEACGVDLQRLVAARPRSGEEALQIMDALLRGRAADLIVVDSVAALVPRAELEVPIGESPAGLHARLMSQGLRSLVARAHAADSVLLFLNQQRTAFDEQGKALTTTTGGQALHFYAATRLEVRRREDELFILVVKDRFGAEGRIVATRLSTVGDSMAPGA